MAVSLPDKHSDLDLSSDSLDRSYEIINDEESGIAIGSTIVCRVSTVNKNAHSALFLKSHNTPKVETGNAADIACVRHKF